MRTARLALVFAVAAVLVGLMAAPPAMASHFRFGSVTWERRADVSPTTVEFTVTAAFRRCGYGGTASDGCPAVGDVITENIGGTQLLPGDGTRIGSPLRFEVTAINPLQDWFLAKAELSDPGAPDKTILHTYPSIDDAGGPWVAAIDSCCRIGSSNHINNRDGDYRVESLVWLVPDNEPPTTGLPPIVSCELDSVCQFLIPGSDPDGDDLRFRRAVSCEASSSCNFRQPGPPFAPNELSIDNETGLVTWDTTGATTDLFSLPRHGLYSTQVMIEDLDDDGFALGHTAVDFFIRVAPVPPHAPTFDTPPSPESGSTIEAVTGRQVVIELQASDRDDGDRIALGDAGLPDGMSCAYDEPAAPVSGRCTWTPAPGQGGEHIVVFTATDTFGLGAAPLSVTIDVAEGDAFTDWHMGDVHTHASGDADLFEHKRCETRDAETRQRIYLPKDECAHRLVGLILDPASRNGAEWVILAEHGPWLGGDNPARYSEDRGRENWNLIRRAADERASEFGVRALLGEELGTAAGVGAAGHFSAYYISDYVKNGPFDRTEVKYVEGVANAGGWGAVNHPDSGSTWDCWYQGDPPGKCGQGGVADFAENVFLNNDPVAFRALELTNDGAFPKDDTLLEWDKLLSRGYKVYGVGGSDAHTTGKSFQNPGGSGGNEEKVGRSSRTYVNHRGSIRPDDDFDSIEEADPVRRALFNGRTVASNGPLAVAQLDGRRPGDTQIVDAGEEVTLNVPWQAPFTRGAADPQVVRVTIAPITGPGAQACGEECVRTFVVSDEQRAADAFQTKFELPDGWPRWYVRVDVLAVGEDENGEDQLVGAFVSPFFIRRG